VDVSHPFVGAKAPGAMIEKLYQGRAGDGSFSWIEYQMLMIALAGFICTALFVVEIALNRFQVLPLLFPGMFRVQERAFFFFNFDISDGGLGKSVRAEAKMVVRITLCVVLSYLWQHCALETTQQVGNEFPKTECGKGADCFASPVDLTTFFNREYTSIDCKGEQSDFDERVVVSCIRIVAPAATTWLMHLGISHSVMTLNFKAFELLVWIGGNSHWARRILCALIFISLLSLMSLFFAGMMAEFVSSWLSFVMSLSIPMFLYCVYKDSKNLAKLWKAEAVQVQQTLEEHLSYAFSDIETAVQLEATTNNDTEADLFDNQQTASSIKERERNRYERRKVIVPNAVKKMKSVVSMGLSKHLRKRGTASTTSISSASGTEESEGEQISPVRQVSGGSPGSPPEDPVTPTKGP